MIYAVNKRTKEHRIADIPQGMNGWVLDGCDDIWDVVQADADGWIEWDGDGECPLPGDATCDAETEMMRYQGVLAKTLQWVKVKRYRPIIDADTKPRQATWNGEGLPPVGCECEVICVDDKFHTVNIVAHDGGRAIYREPTSVCIEYDWRPSSAFRPIRSEEDKAVDEMYPIIDEWLADGPIEMARALYRAGYRRTGDDS